MDSVRLREPCDDDWPAILKLAELSLGEMPAAPSQQEWLDNRRSFSQADGIQRHFVAASGDRIVGYACIEHRNTTPEGVYRLWVVVVPDSRTTLATWLLAELRECLMRVGARSARMVEYQADARFLSYLVERGFVKGQIFTLDNGSPVVGLTMDAPFPSLAELT
jgi:hypothetical protein